MNRSLRLRILVSILLNIFELSTFVCFGILSVETFTTTILVDSQQTIWWIVIGSYLLSFAPLPVLYVWRGIQEFYGKIDASLNETQSCLYKTFVDVGRMMYVILLLCILETGLLAGFGIFQLIVSSAPNIDLILLDERLYVVLLVLANLLLLKHLISKLLLLRKRDSISLLLEMPCELVDKRYVVLDDDRTSLVASARKIVPGKRTLAPNPSLGTMPNTPNSSQSSYQMGTPISPSTSMSSLPTSPNPITPSPSKSTLRDAKECEKCHSAFSIAKKKSNCANCGGCFCENCLSQRIVIKGAPRNVCDKCYLELVSM